MPHSYRMFSGEPILSWHLTLSDMIISISLHETLLVLFPSDSLFLPCNLALVKPFTRKRNSNWISL
jgi:hypothetical protein